jgi:hypothetical protein
MKRPRLTETYSLMNVLIKCRSTHTKKATASTLFYEFYNFIFFMWEIYWIMNKWLEHACTVNSISESLAVAQKFNRTFWYLPTYLLSYLPWCLYNRPIFIVFNVYWNDKEKVLNALATNLDKNLFRPRTFFESACTPLLIGNDWCITISISEMKWLAAKFHKTCPFFSGELQFCS